MKSVKLTLSCLICAVLLNISLPQIKSYQVYNDGLAVDQLVAYPINSKLVLILIPRDKKNILDISDCSIKFDNKEVFLEKWKIVPVSEKYIGLGYICIGVLKKQIPQHIHFIKLHKGLINLKSTRLSNSFSKKNKSLTLLNAKDFASSLYLTKLMNDKKNDSLSNKQYPYSISKPEKIQLGTELNRIMATGNIDFFYLVYAGQQKHFLHQEEKLNFTELLEFKLKALPSPITAQISSSHVVVAFPILYVRSRNSFKHKEGSLSYIYCLPSNVIAKMSGEFQFYNKVQRSISGWKIDISHNWHLVYDKSKTALFLRQGNQKLILRKNINIGSIIKPKERRWSRDYKLGFAKYMNAKVFYEKGIVKSIYFKNGWSIIFKKDHIIVNGLTKEQKIKISYQGTLVYI